MTPKEKAKELVDKIKKATTFQYQEYAGSNYSTFEHDKDTIKQCAVICVDQILSNFDGIHKPEYCAFDAIGERKFTYDGEYDTHMTGYDMVEYWNEVKLEIEKL